MNRLRELRLHGFKTFADPTRFAFEPGVNAVIGPNGSGKSNMADAVRWVLGEQSNKSLRTRRADDVIFAGSQQRRPQGFAEAVLVLDNRDGWLPIEFAEVSITRRAYGSGESEYLINGAKARLRDVVDLLAAGRLGANELVVVGQGTVDSALSLRPDERRQLFEEAAGVKNLQVRKNEALGRLGRAEDNLARVGDLVGELRPQVRRLRLQADHQQEHASLVRRARALVIEAHRRREQAARSRLGDARRRAAAAEAALEGLRAEQAKRQAAVRDAETRYWAADAAATEARRERDVAREARIRAEGREEAARSRATQLAAELAATEDELLRTEEERAAATGDHGPDAAEAAQRAAIEAHAAWDAATARLAESDAAVLAAEELLARARHAESGRVASGARRERLAADLVVARSDAERAAAAREGARERVSAAEGIADAGTARVARAAEAVDGARAAAEAGRVTASALAERVGVLRSELEAMDARLAGPGRLGPVLMTAGWRSLLDALDPPREAWAALEAVVGESLESTLLWRDAALVDRLAEVRGGARLLEVGSAAAGPEAGERALALAAVGGTRTLADWLGPTADMPILFHRVVVAPDVGQLLHGWRLLPVGWSAVTADGDLADGRGLVAVRGRRERSSDEASRRRERRRELVELLEALDAEQAAAGAEAARLLVDQRAALDEHATASQAVDEQRSQLAAVRAELAAAAADAEQAERRVVALAAELERIEVGSSSGPIVEDVARLEGDATVARARRAEAAAAVESARERWMASRDAAEAADRLAGSAAERALRDARRVQLSAARSTLAASLAASVAEQERLTAELDGARAADDRATDHLATAEADEQARRADLRDLERSIGERDAASADLERAAQSGAIEVSRDEDALEAIGRERELALESLPDAPAGPAVLEPPGAGDAAPVVELGVLDDDALAAELRRVRRTLDQIGSVNPFAVEEHRELAERLTSLETQAGDLSSASTATRELIARLDTEIGERFNAAFAAIGGRFDAFCRLLFAGGSASLQLAEGGDGEAPGGIEIVVEPPGKRPQRLSMLSGGERALTGVALLFAMLDVNPVPFCILDEVDAALDEANIGRFAQALRQLAERTNFVVITHNRATIEVADTIYGVTMTDAAVSKVVSLRLADVPVAVSAG